MRNQLLCPVKSAEGPEINPRVWSLLIKSCGFSWKINDGNPALLNNWKSVKYLIRWQKAAWWAVSEIQSDVTSHPPALYLYQALTSRFFSFLGLCFISSLGSFFPVCPQYYHNQFISQKFTKSPPRLQLFTRPVFKSLAAPFAELSVHVCRGGNSKSLRGILALQLTPPTRWMLS